MNNLQKINEIDLIEALQIIWEGKWIVTVISTILFVSVFFAMRLMPSPSFTATTEFNPIPPEQAELYSLLNNFGVFTISSNDISRNLYEDQAIDSTKPVKEVPSVFLLETYFQFLARREVFQEGIKKFGVLNRSDYDSDEAYDAAVVKLAASIEISLPPNTKGIEKRGIIQFNYNDEAKWLLVLEYASEYANREISTAIRRRFANFLKAEKLKRRYAIEDLQIKQSILMAAYTKTMNARVAILREQAIIARELGIETYSAGTQKSEARVFDMNNHSTNQNGGIIYEVTSGVPLYMNGYKSLEKEIDLIRSRKDIGRFVPGFLELDQKIEHLNKDKVLERAEAQFLLTPIGSQKGFMSASIRTGNTKFEYNSKRSLVLALVFFGSFILGIIFVLSKNAKRN